MRNGVVADALRRRNPAYRVIFGLNLPQLAEIAAGVGEDADFARELHADTRTRESQLLAPMVFPAGEMDEREALEWMGAVTDTEVADVMCHRLLRRLPCARALAIAGVGSESEMMRYTGLRLWRNLLPGLADEAEECARRELARGCQLTKGLALNIIDEIEFIRES